MAKFVSYKNHFLVAAPNMKDPVFSRAVVYLCEHSEKGAMGIVINNPLALSVASLMERVGIDNQNEALEAVTLFDGGPVQVERGFILHTNLHKPFQSTLPISQSLALSTSKDVLEAIADPGKAPEKFLVSLGYSGWSEGQLESELAVSGWLIAPVDESILFDKPVGERYEAALALLGLSGYDLSSWVQGTGNA